MYTKQRLTCCPVQLTPSEVLKNVTRNFGNAVNAEPQSSGDTAASTAYVCACVTLQKTHQSLVFAQVLPFFESMGFRLPERKGVADFLQEVTSQKDQAQYWARDVSSYRFIPVSLVNCSSLVTLTFVQICNYIETSTLKQL